MMEFRKFLNTSILIFFAAMFFASSSFAQTSGKNVFFFKVDGYRFESWASVFLKDGTHVVTASGMHYDEKTSKVRDAGWYTWMQKPGCDKYELENVFQDNTTIVPEVFRGFLNASGSFLVAGDIFDKAGNRSWILRERSPSGVWKTVDDYAGTNGKIGSAWSVTEKGFTTWAVGYHGSSETAADRRAVVRMKNHFGGSWKTILEYHLPGSTWSRGVCPMVDHRGRLFVAGFGDAPNGMRVGFVIGSLNGGRTWTLVDKVLGAIPQDCFVDRQGNFYYTGASVTEATRGDWLLRGSMNGGTTWRTLDQENTSSEPWAYGHGLVQDSRGFLYHAIAYFGDEIAGTLIRKAACPTCAWSNFHHYPGEAGRDIAAVKTMAIHNDVIRFSGYESSVKDWMKYAAQFVRQVLTGAPLAHHKRFSEMGASCSISEEPVIDRIPGRSINVMPSKLPKAVKLNRRERGF